MKLHLFVLFQPRMLPFKEMSGMPVASRFCFSVDHSAKGAGNLFSFRAHNHLKVGRAGKGLMALLCTVLLWFSISASHAQQGGAPAESRDASYEALADLLEDRQIDRKSVV